MQKYIEYRDALDLVLEHTVPLDTETVQLAELHGRCSVCDITAREEIPPFNNSAMDGYAVLSEDVKSATPETPVTLTLSTEIFAGDSPTEKLLPGTTAKIMTGAPLPPGADAVVKKEDTEISGQNVIIQKAAPKNNHVRFRGEDIHEGDIVVRKNDLLNPALVGMLASQNITSVEVFRKPVVALLSTGSEIIEPGTISQPGKIRNSNPYALSGLVEQSSAIPLNLGTAIDTEETLLDKFKQCLSMDVMVTSGGVSVGDKDLVVPVLEKLGVNIVFWKCKIKPGKPVVFGMHDRCAVFGLPGNPVSAMVTFELFVRPALLKMQGFKNIFRMPVNTTMDEGFSSSSGRTEYVRAITHFSNGEFRSRLTGPQGSGILRSMALANSLLRVPADTRHIDKGAVLQAIINDFPLTDINYW